MKRDILSRYQEWRQKAAVSFLRDSDVEEGLRQMEPDAGKIEDAFYRDLAFGTGGLRGLVGAGTNRMNIYTVAKASQGLADYVKKNFPPKERRIAVSYDSRIKSDLFARTACMVFAANGILVSVYPRLMPTPCLSFAVRELHCAAGVMVTASHNPAEYNGYKVYGADGCQITTQAAADILAEIEKLDIFSDVKATDFHSGIEDGLIQYISPETDTAYIEAVKGQSLLGNLDVDKNVSIVYTPLNGTGLQPVLRVLKESGFRSVKVVREQEEPDGHFPTCPYPNPEVREAMELGITYARENHADLLLATDPDCDRVGIAVRDNSGDFVLLSGNETGLLLLDYICSRRVALGTMPEEPVFIKTIVTTDLADAVAAHYGVRTVNVLTGFKFIGEQIGLLEQNGKEDSYIFGFEESCGYLSGTYVRDKDAVVAVLLICEMYAFYARQGVSLTEKLKEIYDTYGYMLNTLHSYGFTGAAGMEKMKEIMGRFRENTAELCGRKISSFMDYSKGLDGLPASDVLRYCFEDGSAVVIRPSGTEPKLKVYLSVRSESREETERYERELMDGIEGFIGR